MSDVFCDFLGVTFSNDDWAAVRGELEPVLDSVGASVAFDGKGETLWRLGDGTVKAKRYGPVTALGASGAMLAALRLSNVLAGYLRALAGVGHRVTRLDASKDRQEATAPVIAELREKSISPDGLRLTRKRIAPRHVTRLVAAGVDGLDTGTCYVGSRMAEVRACVYDKRQERIDRGLVDVGPLTRYELRVKSQVGATLRDAMDPESLFWHFMAPDVLPRPAHVAAWEPHGEGFAIEWGAKPLPAARLVQRVQASPDIAALVRLSDEVGPYGFALLVSEMQKLRGGVWAQPTVTAPGVICASPSVTAAGAGPPLQ